MPPCLIDHWHEKLPAPDAASTDMNKGEWMRFIHFPEI